MLLMAIHPESVVEFNSLRSQLTLRTWRIFARPLFYCGGRVGAAAREGIIKSGREPSTAASRFSILDKLPALNLCRHHVLHGPGRRRNPSHGPAPHPGGIPSVRQRHRQPATRRPPVRLLVTLGVAARQRRVRKPGPRHPVPQCQPRQKPLRPVAQWERRRRHEHVCLLGARPRAPQQRPGHVHRAPPRATPLHHADLLARRLHGKALPRRRRAQPGPRRGRPPPARPGWRRRAREGAAGREGLEGIRCHRRAGRDVRRRHVACAHGGFGSARDDAGLCGFAVYERRRPRGLPAGAFRDEGAGGAASRGCRAEGEAGEAVNSDAREQTELSAASFLKYIKVVVGALRVRVAQMISRARNWPWCMAMHHGSRIAMLQ